jgi:ATP-dependent exoDNAse (exonuclease V) alpha subunit
MTPVTEPTPPRIELNDQFRHALDMMENTTRSVFVTGRAGTGKSTLLTHFRRNTRKNVAVLAPTGVAALNVQGQTIHSFFGFRPNITIDKVKRVRLRDESKSIYRKLDAIVIDEISMVRADLLDCVDRFLRLNGPDADAPFGGIQMIFIGDLYQLPPVVAGAERMVFGTLYDSPYFYSARSFGPLDMEFIELEKVYRQRDKEFIDLLNSIRNNSITEEGLQMLNRRCDPSFEPPPGQFYIYLTTTNDLAAQINDAQLAKLKSEPHTFKAEIEGDFGDEFVPTRVELQVKVGSQIMMLNNDPEERWVNGSIGQITEVVGEGDRTVIVARLSEGETVEITPFTWEIYRFFVAEGQLQSEVVGRFTQYPLMLAWAVTIHKSQGKTFDRVVIDIGKGTFAHGQTYVALSRCTTLDGIVLKRPLLKRHVLTDYRVMRFLTGRRYQESEKAVPVADKVEMLEKAAREKTPVHMIYLKPNDEKSFRTIMPIHVGEMEYQGKRYVGVRAFCLTRHEERTFRVDRILEMRV